MHRPSDARCCFRRRTGGPLLQGPCWRCFSAHQQHCTCATLHTSRLPTPPLACCSALAHLASASGVSREREEFMELVEKEIGRYCTALYCTGVLLTVALVVLLLLPLMYSGRCAANVEPTVVCVPLPTLPCPAGWRASWRRAAWAWCLQRARWRWVAAAALPWHCWRWRSLPAVPVLQLCNCRNVTQPLEPPRAVLHPPTPFPNSLPPLSCLPARRPSASPSWSTWWAPSGLRTGWLPSCSGWSASWTMQVGGAGGQAGGWVGGCGHFRVGGRPEV